MAWCLPGNKPLSEPMKVSLLTYICVTRPQWVNKTAIWYSESWITWSKFYRPHFLMHFLEWIILKFRKYHCLQEYNWQNSKHQSMLWVGAISHNLNRCWPQSTMPHGAIGMQWVKECVMNFFPLLFHELFISNKPQFTIWIFWLQ